MRVLVTGASGWIGSAVVPELLSAGHSVVGLARSDASAEAITALGAEAQRGSLDDPESLAEIAAETDGVIHLAFVHDFGNFAESVATDLRAIEAIGGALEGSQKPFVIASGTLGLSPGQVATEDVVPTPPAGGPRAANAARVLELADHGVRSSIVRLSPTVHGEGDQGFVPTLIDTARRQGSSGYVGDGTNRWTGVHRSDAARLFRLALEDAPAGSVLHAADEEGVSARDIAEVIGRHLDVPVVSVDPDDAVDHFGWIGPFFSIDQPVSHTRTTELLGWKPQGPGLLEDLDAGHYFTAPAH